MELEMVMVGLKQTHMVPAAQPPRIRLIIQELGEPVGMEEQVENLLVEDLVALEVVLTPMVARVDLREVQRQDMPISMEDMQPLFARHSLMLLMQVLEDMVAAVPEAGVTEVLPVVVVDIVVGDQEKMMLTVVAVVLTIPAPTKPTQEVFKPATVR